jgi:hypothetical protein
MRRCAPILCAVFAIAFQAVQAQTPANPRRRVAPQAAAATALPVRRVVLYKNGVGYFEHVGRVVGNQSISIDFNSAQLNDALKSLTVLDLGGGRIADVSFNSETPLAVRLGALPLPAGPGTTVAELLGAMRGARLEVTSGGRAVVGRLLSVERRPRGKDDSAPRDQFTIVTDAGEIRTVDLTPSVGVKLAERESNAQVGAYLGLLASARAQDRRRVTISALGAGARDLLVGYISEVPIWKTTYRIVLPSDARSKPLLQGWAVVDTTVGEDWTDVRLSLVAGAPQSFVQPLSQPLYVQRPVVAMPKGTSTAPQMHLEGSSAETGGVIGRVIDQAGETLPGVSITATDSSGRRFMAISDEDGQYALAVPRGTYHIEYDLAGFRHSALDDVEFDGHGERAPDVTMSIGSLAETVTVSGARPRRFVNAAAGGGVGAGFGGGVAGNIGREEIEQGLANLQAAARGENLGDLFEYRVADPITIRKNQSALVPIVRAEIAVDRVSLWNERAGVRPLRALWLTNSSGLTLDGGSFAVLDEATFAGEGLLEPITPGEKRLLSYGVDLGLQVESRQGDEHQQVARIRITRGVAVQQREERTRKVYTIRNSDASARTVVVEHTARPGWKLVGGSAPTETSLAAYRFLVPVAAKSEATLTVEETRPVETRDAISQLTDNQIEVFVRESRENVRLTQALVPIQAKKSSIAALTTQIAAHKTETTQITDDQTRVRGNMGTLKGSASEQVLLKRYVAQLNQQEDRLGALRRETADLEQARVRAQADLAQLVDALSLDIDVTAAAASVPPPR